MPAETIDYPVLSEAPDPGVYIEQATAFDFNIAETSLINSQRRMDRLDPAMNSMSASEADVQSWYQTLDEIARLKETPSSDTEPPSSELEKITDERLGYDIALAGGFYKNLLTTGTLTAYNLPADQYNVAALQAIEDPQERSRLQAEYAKQRSPSLVERLPIKLSDATSEDLLGADEQVRREAVAELLDPYRRRHDRDAGPDNENDQQVENQQIDKLLESLGPSWQRDLLAADAWRFFVHPNIHNPAMAEQAIGLMSPESGAMVRALHERLLESNAKEIVKGYAAQSRRSLEDIEKDAARAGIDTSDLAEAANNIKPDLRLSINVRDNLRERSSFGVILKFLLEDHHLLSAYEVGEGRGTMVPQGRRDYETGYGLDPYDLKLDKPISGTLNHYPDSVLHGDATARTYGRSTVVLKPEVARERGLYFTGDGPRTAVHALEDYSHESAVMTFDEAAAAKVIHDRKRQANPNRSIEYMEGIAIGGVSPDDVESITVPFNEVIQVSRGLRTIADRYPSIQFNCTLSAEEAAENADYIAAMKAANIKNIHLIVEDYEPGSQPEDGEWPRAAWHSTAVETAEDRAKRDEVAELAELQAAFAKYRPIGSPEYQDANNDRVKDGKIKVTKIGEERPVTLVANIKIDPQTGEVVSGHDYNPEAQSMADTEQAFADYLAATPPEERAVIYEGDERVIADRDEAIAQATDSGLIQHLADREGVPAIAGEPTTDETISKMGREGIAPEEILALFVARGLESQLAGEDPAFLAGYINHQAAELGLDGFHEYSEEEKQAIVAEGKLDEVKAELAQKVEALLPTLNSMYAPALGKDLFVVRGDGIVLNPELQTEGKQINWDSLGMSGDLRINEIARLNMEMRDLTIFRRIAEARRSGKSPFVVYGGSHMVTIEPALRAYIEA